MSTFTVAPQPSISIGRQAAGYSPDFPVGKLLCWLAFLAAIAYFVPLEVSLQIAGLGLFLLTALILVMNAPILIIAFVLFYLFRQL